LLRIKRDQMALAGEGPFVDRTVRHMRVFHDAAVADLPDDELRRRVVHGLERARRHGLTWEYSLTVFVAHMLELSPTFDEHPAVARVLADTSLPPDERMDELLARLTDEQWDEVVAQGDEDAYWRSVFPPDNGEAEADDDFDDDDDDDDEEHGVH
jgi:hypothetical protein